MDKITIHVAREVGSGICISAEDGSKIYDLIRNNILANRIVELSFESITRITTAFLNVAVGQLYGEFPEERIRLQLARPINADGRVISRLRLVVERAKIFFADKDSSDRIVSDVIGLGDEH